MSLRRASTAVLPAMFGCFIGATFTALLFDAPHVAVAPTESESAGAAEVAPMVIAAAPVAPSRAPVDETVNLQREIAELRAQLARRAGLRAADVARAVPGLSETEVVEAIAKSSLVNDEAALAEMGEAMTPRDVWHALLAEGAYHVAMSEVRSRGPKRGAPHGERVAYFQTVVVPRSLQAFEELSCRLHELRVPRRLVEAFRVRVVEG